MSNLLEVKDKVQRHLIELVGDIQLLPDGRFAFNFHSTRLFIRVSESDSQDATFVVLTAPIVIGVPTSPALFEWVARETGQYLFGHIECSINDDEPNVGDARLQSHAPRRLPRRGGAPAGGDRSRQHCRRSRRGRGCEVRWQALRGLVMSIDTRFIDPARRSGVRGEATRVRHMSRRARCARPRSARQRHRAAARDDARRVGDGGAQPTRPNRSWRKNCSKTASEMLGQGRQPDDVVVDLIRQRIELPADQPSSTTGDAESSTLRPPTVPEPSPRRNLRRMHRTGAARPRRACRRRRTRPLPHWSVVTRSSNSSTRWFAGPTVGRSSCTGGLALAGRPCCAPSPTAFGRSTPTES